MGDDIVSTVRQIDDPGKNQHAEFTKTRIFAHTIQPPLSNVSANTGLSTKSESKEPKMHKQLFSSM